MSNYLNEVSAIVPVVGGPGLTTQGPIEELFASTVRKSGWLWIYYNTIPTNEFPPFSQGILMKMNIYTGAAGLEVVQMCRVPNAGNSNTNPEGGYWNGIGLPWTFNQGVRVSCSIASGHTSALSSRNLVQFRLIEKPI
jgi:hypothetical protein